MGFMFDDDYYDSVATWYNTVKETIKQSEFNVDNTYSTEDHLFILKAKIEKAIDDNDRDLFMELSKEYNELVKC